MHNIRRRRITKRTPEKWPDSSRLALVATLGMALLTLCCGVCQAQFGGNASSYGQAGGSARAEQNERAKRTLTHEEMPPTSVSMFVEANVLMNVIADEYVALFGMTQEGRTVAECGQKMDATLRSFSDALAVLGIRTSDVFVDFAAQNKIYEYEITGDIAREKLAGFELKKNIAIHFRDKALLDKLLVTAAQSQIYDLIKVDYIVRDTAAIQNRLMQAAASVLKQKAANYERLLAIKLQNPAQVYAEKPATYYPTEMYDNYTAYESEDVNANAYRQKYVIQGARKSRTFFFNPLNAKDFDTVINPVVIEPTVQFTLYLKLKYHIAQPAKSEAKAAHK